MTPTTKLGKASLDQSSVSQSLLSPTNASASSLLKLWPRVLTLQSDCGLREVHKCPGGPLRVFLLVPLTGLWGPSWTGPGRCVCVCGGDLYAAGPIRTQHCLLCPPWSWGAAQCAPRASDPDPYAWLLLRPNPSFSRWKSWLREEHGLSMLAQDSHHGAVMQQPRK